MKRKFLFIIISLSLNTIQAQKFDLKDFNKKFKTAEWLYKYDLVAWWSTDSLMTKDKEKFKQLGREWFCFQDSTNTWHSVYGKYENGKYNQVFHFVVKSRNEVSESKEQIDTSFLNVRGKVLKIAFKQMKYVSDSTSIRFNHYIRKNKSGNFDIYIFPAFQPNGTAIYGGEFIYEISPSGEIVRNNSYYQGKFRGYKTDKPVEIKLDYRELKKPTLGGIFFAWYYKSYFSKIFINTKESLSTPFKDGNKYIWIHVEKDLKKIAKSKRKNNRKKKKKN